MLEVSKYGHAHVDIPSQSEINARKCRIVFHNEYAPNSISGEIICILKTITLIHIGSGIYEMAEDAGIDNYSGVIKGIVKENGLPIIPGSSLKGAFRSIVEAISYSCLNQKCEASDYESKLCIACRIFGVVGFMGRASFTKATIKDENDYKTKKANHEIPKSIEMWPPLDKAATGRRFYPYIEYLSSDFWDSSNKDEFDITAGCNSIQEFKQKVVEPYDFIPENVELSFALKFVNLEDKEIGLILTGMGIGLDNQPIFQPHIGGSKKFCFGGIEVKVGQIKIYKGNREDFKTFAASNSSELVSDTNGWINEKIQAFTNKSPNEAENFLFDKGLSQVKEILQYPAGLPVVVI
ncbi:hypothetical protein GF312_20375 [Candidatus Poribacteria bacterium]|nr:hypothetical protein [Candidatus Poribacteria bacterium]